MGKTLADSFPEAARVFQEADEALGFPLSRLCFEGPDDQLKLTENQQPALLTVSIAANAVLAAKGITPAYVAGHSLGEYSALVAAGSLRLCRCRAAGPQARPIHAGSGSRGCRRDGGAP